MLLIATELKVFCLLCFVQRDSADPRQSLVLQTFGRSTKSAPRSNSLNGLKVAGTDFWGGSVLTPVISAI